MLVDLDEEIKNETGLSIAEIFETSGEPAFRRIEAEVLRKLIATCKDSTIIACGGGTPAFSDNLPEMKKAGCVVWLKAPPETVMRQLSKSELIRPLLSEPEPMNVLEKLYEARSPFYEQADLQLDAETLSAGTFAEILESCTNRR